MTTSQQSRDDSNGHTEQNSTNPSKPGQMNSLHPNFLPPCSHPSAGDDGLHAHAFDLLALHNPTLAKTVNVNGLQPAPMAIPAPLPQQQPRSVSASVSTGIQRPRRMSSSTTAALGRGKTALLGTSLGASGEPSGLGLGGISRQSGRTTTPALTRRTSSAATTPVLFDFAKTDSTKGARPGLPAHSYSQPNTRNSRFGASLPASSAGYLARHAAANAVDGDGMELDMDFDDDDDEALIDEEEDGSGSAEREGSTEDADKPAYEKLALGTGSGGVKGRRKGMVFKCENCSKEYRHPSCLVKHRWEHSPHWKEPTQLSMSKHQQVQMLEAAAILMHMDPTGASGRSLPSDKSLWPAALSPPPGHAALTRSGRSSTRDLPNVRSPPSSTAPLTPSSLRGSSPMVNGRPHRQSFGQASQGRKPSPGSESTASSTGQEGQDESQSQYRNVSSGSQPRGIESIDHSRYSRHGSSLSSSIPNLATPNSVGSMPDMAGLHFQTGTTPVNRHSPLPGMASRVGMVGGGMFGAASSYGLNASVPRSSVSSIRGGFGDALQEEEEEDEDCFRRGKSSSEEMEDKKAMHGEEDGWAAGTGMDLDMEL